MNRLAVFLALFLLTGCSRQPATPSNEAVHPEKQVTSGDVAPEGQVPSSVQQTTSVPVVVDGAVPALPVFPSPKIPIPQSPYDESQPHPLPEEKVDVDKVKQAVEEKARNWIAGTFHVNSLWQITNELQLASGFYDGVLVAGVITLPSEGEPEFHAVPKVGGGGPATVVGVRDDWVLIRTGLSYVVFNYRTGESNVSDEHANPGQRTVLWRPQISAEKALQIATSVHNFEVTWWVRFDAGFVYESKGDSRVRPSWIVQTLSPSPNVTIYMDAETGELFRMRESEAPSPTPLDLGFISQEEAIKTGLQGLDSQTVTVAAAALLENTRIPDPPYGLLELPVWRIDLVSKEDGRSLASILVDARSGSVIKPGMAP